MSYKTKIIGGLYRKVFKPVAFMIDPEKMHDQMTGIGEFLEDYPFLMEALFKYNNLKLKRNVLGIEFENPVGLSAGFDYDGHLAAVMSHVGFGFNTVGTVTALPYPGNDRPMLWRLPKSKSLLVNKGFKSGGAKAVAERLDKKNYDGHTVGISVGSSNRAEVNTIKKAIDDYKTTFDIFKNKKYVKYFELNISCPNTQMTEGFTIPKNFELLVRAIKYIKQPIFVKMPNELDWKKTEALINIAVKNNIRGFVFSNLVKDRTNIMLDKNELEAVKNMKGNFSGKPTHTNAVNLVNKARKTFGNKIAIIGVGGIFNPEDANEMFKAGADLVQLITGMIYEGPQLAGEICENIV